LDFDLTLRSSRVKQLFYTEEDGINLVCLRLSAAINMRRMVHTLRQIQTKPNINLRFPADCEGWYNCVYMGEELHEGEGLEIINTLRTHMQDHHRKYYESLSSGTFHVTHMLRDPIRRRGGALSRRNAESPVYNPQTPPGTESDSSQEDAQPQPSGTAAPPESDSEDDAQPLRTDSTAETVVLPPTLPVTPQLSRAGSTETVALFPPPAAVFNPPATINGQPNTVEQGMQMTDTIATVMRNLYNIEPGFNLPDRLDEIMRAVNHLSDRL
jgi:hypothetical protein